MGNPRSYAKLDEQWMTDPAMRKLAAAGHYDSIAVFFGLVAYARANDLDDGHLNAAQVRVVLGLLYADLTALRRLRARRGTGTCRGDDAGGLIITNYAKWQIPRNQGKPSPPEKLSTGSSRRNTLRVNKEETPAATADGNGVIHIHPDRVGELLADGIAEGRQGRTGTHGDARGHNRI